MLKDGPFDQSPGGAPEWVRGLRTFLTFVLAALVCCVIALAAPAPGGKPAAGQAKDPAASDFVGSETCAACHEEVAKGFASNPHTKMAQMHGKNGVTCENCHGAGKAHVDGGGDTAKIFNPGKGKAKEVDAKCLECHQGQHANFEQFRPRRRQCELPGLPQHSRRRGSGAAAQGCRSRRCASSAIPT